MNTRLAALQRRRAALSARSEAQRREIGRLLERWRTPLSIADRVIGVVKRVGTSPLAIPVAVAALYWLGRKGRRHWVGRVWRLWGIYSSLRHPRRSGSGGVQ
jgi:hypothetical protein